jgi:hypothetical protein
MHKNHFPREAWIMAFGSIAIAIIVLILALVTPLMSWIRNTFQVTQHYYFDIKTMPAKCC